MSKESSLKKQEKNLLKQKSHLENVEEEFYGSDKRFEKIFLFNGVISLLFCGATFYGALSGMDSKILTILWGGGLLQILVGIFFALALPRKKNLHKSLYTQGLVIHGILLAGYLFIILVLDKERVLLNF